MFGAVLDRRSCPMPSERPRPRISSRSSTAPRARAASGGTHAN